jgi:hypothetical protein
VNGVEFVDGSCFGAAGKGPSEEMVQAALSSLKTSAADVPVACAWSASTLDNPDEFADDTHATDEDLLGSVSLHGALFSALRKHFKSPDGFKLHRDLTQLCDEVSATLSGARASVELRHVSMIASDANIGVTGAVLPPELPLHGLGSRRPRSESPTSAPPRAPPTRGEPAAVAGHVNGGDCVGMPPRPGDAQAARPLIAPPVSYPAAGELAPGAFYCDLCNCNVSGAMNWTAHLSGSPHARCLRLQQHLRNVARRGGHA